MNKESVLYGVIGLLAGSLLTVVLATTAVNGNNGGMMRVLGMHPVQASRTVTDESMGMNGMTAGLQGKPGDDFDKAFLAEMIIHHQGAIDMAKQAQQSAKHDEVKKLADDIIAAQTKEIAEMKQWQKDWGYSTDDNTMGGMHSVR